MSATLRAAVVGVGYLGNFHSQKYKSLSENKFKGSLELVGVCDLNSAQADKVASSLGVKAFTNYEELVGKVDCVSIATITPAHFEAARFFLKHGIHVNVEKPITIRVDEARELITLAKEKNLVLAVGHSERFNPAFVRLKEIIKKPIWVEFHRHAPFKERGSDVSVLHDLAIHDIDLAFNLLPGKCELTDVCGGKLVTQQIDWSNFIYKFDSGVKALISISRVAPEMNRSIKVIESDRIVFADLQNGIVKTTHFKKAMDTPIQIETENVGKGDNLLIETECFVQSILDKKPAVVTGEDGRRALESVEMILSRLQVH